MRAFRIVAAIINGLLWLGLSVFLLMALGLERHGSYEFYGNYPLLYLGPGLMGFLLPVLLMRLVRPQAAAVGATIALPLGTLGGYVILWNTVSQSPAIGVAGMIVGAVGGTLLGLLIGRVFGERSANERNDGVQK